MIPFQEKNDAPFLRTCVEFLYKENLNVLKSECMCTTPWKDEGYKFWPHKNTNLTENAMSNTEIGFIAKKHLDEFSARLGKKAINQSLIRAIYNINKKNLTKTKYLLLF